MTATRYDRPDDHYLAIVAVVFALSWGAVFYAWLRHR